MEKAEYAVCFQIPSLVQLLRREGRDCPCVKGRPKGLLRRRDLASVRPPSLRSKYTIKKKIRAIHYYPGGRHLCSSHNLT
jgi:hypothetical protein